MSVIQIKRKFNNTDLNRSGILRLAADNKSSLDLNFLMLLILIGGLAVIMEIMLKYLMGLS